MCFRSYGKLKFPLTYNGKSENKCSFIAISLQILKSFQKFSLSGVLPNILFVSNPLNLIGYQGNQNG